MIKILALDPSGTGTTGIFFAHLDQEENTISDYSFGEFTHKDWKEHFEFLFKLVQKLEPNIIIFEDTTYTYGRQHQGTVSLCKLLGSVNAIGHTFGFIQQVGTVPVNSVKNFRDKVQTGTEEIMGLNFEIGRGKGWKYKEKKVSLHQVDALVVYHLWTKENMKSKEVISKEISTLKAKKRLGSRQKEKLEELERIYNKQEKTC